MAKRAIGKSALELWKKSALSRDLGKIALSKAVEKSDLSRALGKYAFSGAMEKSALSRTMEKSALSRAVDGLNKRLIVIFRENKKHAVSYCM